MNKPMNAAAYRAHAEQVKAQRPSDLVTLKSGSVFELCRPNIQTWVMTGRVPQSLLEAGIKAWKEQGKVPVSAQKGSPSIVTDSAIFFVRLVQECTVNPKLVEFPDPDKNEIGPETMLDEDFWEIVGWAMTGQGVAGIDGLQTFRAGRKRGTSGSRSKRKKLQPETVSSAAN